MAKILGLDLGSHTVKAVLFETSMRSPIPAAYAEVRRSLEGDKTETLKAALAQLFAQNDLAADQTVVALPGPGLATHMLTLPFTDPKRLEATIGFEVEGQLPFDISDAVYDYQIANQVDKKSDLLVGVVRKEELATHLALLGAMNVDPRVITHPALTYQNLFLSAPQLFEPPNGDEAIAVVDIGHERTAVAIGRPGTGVEFARTFSGGGKDLSKALANELQAPFEEANQWKEERGGLGPQISGPEGERAATAFTRALQPVLREIRASLKSYAGKARRTVGQVYLCGGTAQLRGIDEQFTRDLNLPTRVLRLPPDVIAAKPTLDQPSVMQPYALALRGQAAGARAPRFNLRRGEYAFKGDFDYMKDKLGTIGAFAAILLVLLVVTGIIRNSVLARGEKALDDQLCEITTRVTGTCERNFDRALNLLQGQASPAADVPKLTAVNILAEFAENLPSDVPATFEDIVVTLDRLTVKGTTESRKQIGTITSALKKYRCFKEITEGKTETSKDGSKTTFNLDIQIQCPDQPAPTPG
ncbi:MAG: pilus assembly protein PilM [Myxococcaceae bacterium]